MPGNIAKNVTSRSIRDVYRINNLLSAMTLIFSFSYLILEQYQLPYMGIKSGLYILSTGYSQAFVLRYCATRYIEQPTFFKVLRYSLGFGLGILIYFLFWYLFGLMMDVDPHFDSPRWIIIYIMIACFLNFIIFVLHDFVIIRGAKIKADLENYQLQMRNTEAENLILKQQIHPHFLFNALNTLNLLYKKDQTMGEQYLLRLSDFLRVSVSQNRIAVATLGEELSICNNYLEMQKIRFGNAIQWEVIIEDDDALQKEIPSFSLQPLLENAIKHNGFTQITPLNIKIIQHGDSIEVSNNICKKKYNEVSLKSGLSNLTERYRLLTGSGITVTKNSETFSVSLKFI
ncbi:histidine kinase [uncultured Chryseobacterium sp.]|uniref:sensor histidine kinase n=1 Tax=uncultured Chryseobacterium sp. TaxID=259322 RepID=UPI0025844431|nr:histidine kinase [uncultured Chryseobacterium sp.]